MKISVAEKLTNGALVTPIPGHMEHCTIAPVLINYNVKYMGLNNLCKTTIKRLHIQSNSTLFYDLGFLIKNKKTLV